MDLCTNITYIGDVGHSDKLNSSSSSKHGFNRLHRYKSDAK